MAAGVKAAVPVGKSGSAELHNADGKAGIQASSAQQKQDGQHFKSVLGDPKSQPAASKVSAATTAGQTPAPATLRGAGGNTPSNSATDAAGERAKIKSDGEAGRAAMNSSFDAERAAADEQFGGDINTLRQNKSGIESGDTKRVLGGHYLGLVDSYVRQGFDNGMSYAREGVNLLKTYL